MQKYSKLFKSTEAKKNDILHLNDLLMQFEENPLELMDKTIKKRIIE